jgi:hypothetical protein
MRGDPPLIGCAFSAYAIIGLQAVCRKRSEIREPVRDESGGRTANRARAIRLPGARHSVRTAGRYNQRIVIPTGSPLLPITE